MFEFGIYNLVWFERVDPLHGRNLVFVREELSRMTIFGLVGMFGLQSLIALNKCLAARGA